MITHDPFQAYATLGPSYGIPSQLGLPYPTGPINPAALHPLLNASPMGQLGAIHQMGQAPYGWPGQPQLNPQQLQLAALLSAQGGYPNPIAASLLSNPLLAASLYSSHGLGGPQSGFQPQTGPFGSPFSQISPFGQIGSPFGQGGSPFGQGGSPFGQGGYPLAPQTWIGQGGMFGGQGFGQMHPLLSQLGQRPFQTQGFGQGPSQGLSPWGF